MSISIQFAQRQNVFTNMDTISGKIILYLLREDSFSAINVKLEGEGRTRLAHPLGTRSGDRGETELEVHKLLYNIQTVFPTNPILGAKAYTLPAGQHEFQFSFRIPFNNSCNENNIKRLKMGGLQVDMRDVNQHTKAPLPPTLAGFPGEAEIKYYVKVTAERPAFYKENFRNQINFKFLPIEKPRPPTNTRETYGRRKHQFSPHAGSTPGKSSTSLFSRKYSTSNHTPDNAIPPLISVDARLPDPAIVTCNEALPLRVLITKLNDSPEAIFLRTFQITLWGHTRIRAHALERVETSSWVLSSIANKCVELQPEDPDSAAANTNPTSPSASGPSSSNVNTTKSTTSASKDGKDATSAPGSLYPMLIDPVLWRNSTLPPSVAPSFESCNLSRWYELEISVGLSWGTPGAGPSGVRPELTVQPIRLRVDVYSGIAPSPALISRFLSQSQHPQRPSASLPVRPNASPAAGGFAPPQPPRPGQVARLSAPVVPEADPGAAGPSSAQAQAEAAPAYDEPPPSYEDAMAEDLAPVDGIRQDYQVPESAPVGGDRKRRDS